jgi:hypothetical protein
VEPGDHIGEDVTRGDVRPVEVVHHPQGRTQAVQLVDEVVGGLEHAADGDGVGLRAGPDHELEQCPRRVRRPVVGPLP